MRKILLVMLIAFSISALGYSLVHAVGAVIIQGEQCIVGEEATGLTAGLITRNMTTVEAPDGIVKTVCTFNIPEGSEPDKSQKNRGFSCRIPTTSGSVYTEDTLLVMSPGGTAVLTCKYKP